MQTRTRRATGAAVACGAALLAATLAGSAAGAHGGLHLTSIAANPTGRGIVVPNAVSPQLDLRAVAQGAHKLENPAPNVAYYGYNGNGTLMPDPKVVQAPGTNVESSKTEPDKNTYLRLHGLHGADPNYNYGSRFLFQGHEGGLTGYITRINLDADAQHRVTLLASTLTTGAPFAPIDGSTWDPWARRLLFTVEAGANGAVLQSTPDVNAQVEDISFVTGRGGYEGIQNDSAGNLWIVEDVGGTTVGTRARNPNSFVYRLVPADKSDLKKGGKLQALQVTSNRTHTPIRFQPVDATHPTGGAFTDDQKDLSAYGNTFDTQWVTIHDTTVDTSGQPFDANALAKAAGATPFKRPENGVFRPGTGFREFFFTVTGDTNTTSTANPGFGGWGGLFKLSQHSPTDDSGRLSLFYAGDQAHTGLDNIAFIDRDHVASVEDASSTVHNQRNALDSAYLFDARTDYARGAQPVRFIAEGRDPSATEDAMLLEAGNGFQNDDDNEITGIHMSDGDPGPGGILGAKNPRPFDDGWRLFWTQQHGDNITWEVVER
jgi:hypothetical protein